MSESVRVAIRVPLALEMDFLQRVITDGYGMKGKSKWVGEAISHFMNLADFEEYVEYADELNLTERTKIQAFYFDNQLVRAINDAVIRVRRQYPHLEGIKSLIIRSSIIQRLFRRKDEYTVGVTSL